MKTKEIITKEKEIIKELERLLNIPKEKQTILQYTYAIQMYQEIVNINQIKERIIYEKIKQKFI